jgi:long-chain acyl-CoA synthetase
LLLLIVLGFLQNYKKNAKINRNQPTFAKNVQNMVHPSSYTLASILENSVSLFGDKLLSTMGDVSVSYNDMGRKAAELRFFFHKHGINRGDKIAIIGENMPNWGVAYFGTTSMGAVAVPVLVNFSAVEINNILNHSEARVLIASSKVLEKLESNLEFDGKIVCMNDFSIPSTGELISDYCNDKAVEFGQMPSFNVEPDDLATIIYTSGTTGRSKGVMLTHENLVWDAYKCTTIHPVCDKDIYLSVLPLAHTYECTLGLILGLMQGSTTHYIDKAPTANVLMPLLKKIRPTMMLTVPLIIEKMFKVGIKEKFMKNAFTRILYLFRPTQILLHRVAGKKLYRIFGGRLGFFGIGGAAVAPEVERFLRDAHFPYSCGYGLTETSPMIFGASVGKTTYRSVGPVMDGVEAKLINVNALTREGEVVVRGRNVMRGYYKEPNLTAEVLDPDGWFKTGDLGVFDKKGNLSLKGRSKNMILGASGENIYPEEIEAIINEMDGVVESVVYQHKGKLVAQVYLNKDEFSKRYQEMLKSAHNYSEELGKRMDQYIREIKAKVNQSVGKHAQLSDMQLTEEPFEKTATLKIKRYTLAKEKKEKDTKEKKS